MHLLFQHSLPKFLGRPEPDRLNLERIPHANVKELRKSSSAMFLIYRENKNRVVENPG